MSLKLPKVRLNEWLEPGNLLLLKDYARRGMTDKEIAKSIGIGRTTFYNWIKKSKEFEEAIKEGRKPVIVEVEDSFIRECTGYWVTEITEKEDSKGNITTITSEKWIRPNVSSMMFYLKNKDPEHWTDRKTERILSKVDLTINNIEDMVRIYQVEEDY